ncbi:hypothetical protein EVJ58_g5982 [Rhodofomes roseus]|nr:hypothetical protein EVJ58_g5982 [Rhodofomes roseus]
MGVRESKTATDHGPLSAAIAAIVSESLPHDSSSTESTMDMASPLKPAQEASREELENVMDTTREVEKAWEAFQHLSAMPLPEGRRLVRYYARLHRLARLLSKVKPRTRTLFLRLFSVLSMLHKNGGHVHHWEWTLLIDCTGKGQRKGRPQDYKASLDVYRDMIEQKAPGSTSSRVRTVRDPQDNGRPVVQPNVVTYNTLLNIAGRTFQPSILRHARGVFEASGIPPDRITYLSLVRYYSRTNDLNGVRAILLKMREQGMELGLDGINACIWAYGRAGRLDVASLLYRIVRHNLVPEDQVGQNDIQAAIRQLAHMEGLEVPVTIKPDTVTYNILIQCYAYRGDLTRSLEVFREMMAVNEQLHSLGQSLSDDDPSRTDRAPSMHSFRAIFYGFVRHGGKTDGRAGPVTQRATSQWRMENLQALFDIFMRLPHDTRPSARTFFWILTAFDRLSGHADWKLRQVWEKFTEKFGDYRGGRMERIRMRVYESNQKSS